jgi:cytidylate kinase
MAIFKPGASSDPLSSRLAERRIREWTMALEAEQRRSQEAAQAELQNQVKPYVAISREAGAGGGGMARRVGELLGWDVFHRELLDTMAKKYDLPRDMLGTIDEKTANWLVEVFGKWLDPRLVTQTEYIVHLGKIVLLAAQYRSSVFVGRGAQFVLPADRGISVFLVAPLPQRIRHIRDFLKCSESEAKRYIRDTDKGRRDLVKRYFNREIGDPRCYDFVINRERISIDAAAELIVQQCRQRFPEIDAAAH